MVKLSGTRTSRSAAARRGVVETDTVAHADPAAPSRDLIVDAAEHVAAHDGFAALTLRAVAARLGAAPMALYRYFATKDDLVNALLDRVLGRFEAPAPSADWVADFRRFAHAHRLVLVHHPGAGGLLQSSQPGVQRHARRGGRPRNPQSRPLRQ